MNFDKQIVPFMLIAILATAILIFFMIVIIIVLSKRQNRKEKEFLRTLIEERERTYHHISLELNKLIINNMTASRMYLHEIEDNENNQNNENQAGIRKALAAIDRALYHFYHLDNNLDPHSLTKYGLYTAVSEYLEWIKKTSDVKCSLQLKGNPKNIPLFESIMLFRIIQESLINSLNHAQAKEIIIIFFYEGSDLDLVISDDGIGFDISCPDFNAGVGIKSIRQRSKQLRGNLNINTRPNFGTEIKLHIDKIFERSLNPF